MAKTNKRGYWWECDKCKGTVRFNKREFGSLLWGLAKGGWEKQSLLERRCENCKQDESLHITHHFPPSKESIRVIRIVGIYKERRDFLPMMWEAIVSGKQRFDFKYIKGNKTKTLASPAVLTEEELVSVFKTYRVVAERPGFLAALIQGQ